MARLKPVFKDGQLTDLFEAVNDLGEVVAVGVLEVDDLPGQFIGEVRFVGTSSAPASPTLFPGTAFS